MARLKVKNMKNIQTKVRKKIRSVLKLKAIRNGVGDIVVDAIQDGSFGSPSDKYRAWRSRNDSLNKTHGKYDKDNINITFTGELLKDLRNNVKADFDGSKSSYIIEHSDGSHKPYKTKGGKTKSVTYKKISKGLQKLYPYLTFHRGTQANILKFIKTELFKRIK
jgi:hypothetical protein